MKGEMLNLAEERQDSVDAQKEVISYHSKRLQFPVMLRPKAGSREVLWKKVGSDWAEIGTLQLPLPDAWHSYLKNFLLQSWNLLISVIFPIPVRPTGFLHPCKWFCPYIRESSNINKWVKKHLFSLVLNAICHLIWSPLDILLNGGDCPARLCTGGAPP